MNPKETALLGLVATAFSIMFCQLLVRAAGHSAQLSSAQASAGLAICLAGVAVGLLLVLCVSAFHEVGSGWHRSLGAVGLALGCALLFALLVSHRSAHAASTPPAMHDSVAVGNGTLLLAPGTSR
jgi:hypothetical protein